ncbi:MAG: undecaprenyl/decaprenyl-phosphate alpha-N-acetylglucosaminyl 1-phosphate transferase [Phycisphaerae bacterium]|nr:undecaprenyl/decaprenyl-phosphate alpha-N-acetylglucosaminyl 1-phosphate transferase [Phycisphaerae bacterium]
MPNAKSVIQAILQKEYEDVTMLAMYSVVEVLREIWWLGVVALLVSLGVTPLVRFIAYRAKIVDKPDALLKPHGRPIAYLGGVAMCIGLLVGLVVYAFVMPDASQWWNRLGEDLAEGRVGKLMGLDALVQNSSPRKAAEVTANPAWQLLAIALSSVLITIVGLLDDLFQIRPNQKVLGQVIAAVILIFGGVGLKISFVLFYHLHLPLPPPWAMILLSGLFCMVMVIATCNATNLLDGLDGLCGGVTGIVTLGFLALAVFLATYAHFDGTTDQLRVGLALAMAGAVFGFLPYNIPPASIFMGDAGSMLLGFFVAVMMAMFCREGHVRFFLAACVVFALPILDTALAVVRRLLAGKNIFAGDRSHLYDQLVDRGMSVKQVVVLFYILAAAAAIIGVLSAICLRTRYALLLDAVLLAVVWGIFLWLGMVHPDPREAKPDSAPKDDA